MKRLPRPFFNFTSLVEESVRIHGHLCPGQVLGVRMSIFRLREIYVDDPKGKDRKNIIVFVEMDRCATDAIQSVTGCTLKITDCRTGEKSFNINVCESGGTGRRAGLRTPSGEIA